MTTKPMMLADIAKALGEPPDVDDVTLDAAVAAFIRWAEVHPNGRCFMCEAVPFHGEVCQERFCTLGIACRNVRTALQGAKP